MKKAIGIVLCIIVATSVAAMIFYYIRAYRAERQYVHRNSASILSFAVDDLLIDNISPLISSQLKQRSSTDSSKSVLFREIWHAGVAIPARIYLYSLPDDASTFYSIQQINDPQRWDKFLKRYRTTTDPKGKEESIQIGKHITILTSGDKIFIRLSLKDSLNNVLAASELQQDDNWVQVRKLPAWKNRPNLDHITYCTRDEKLIFQAHISNEKTTISGNCQVEEKLPKGPKNVRIASDQHVALRIWSHLPLSAAPSIPQILAKFSDIPPESPQMKAPRYVDLLVGQQLVSQQDTIITYDYDENFNSIETRIVQKNQVPLIESLWQGDSAFAQQLPDKVFYKFYKKVDGEHILLSTDPTAPTGVKYEDKQGLLFFQANFKNWPSIWLIEPFKSMQQQAFTLTVEAVATNERILEIKGDMSYKPLVE